MGNFLFGWTIFNLYLNKKGLITLLSKGDCLINDCSLVQVCSKHNPSGLSFNVVELFVGCWRPST
jgi:hypothetical protein